MQIRPKQKVSGALGGIEWVRLFQALKEGFQADLMSHQNLMQGFDGEVLTFFNAPVMLAVHAVMQGKFFIAGKACLDAQGFDFCGNSCNPLFFCNALHNGEGNHSHS